MGTSADGKKYIDVEIGLGRKFIASLPSKEIEYEVEFRSSKPDDASDIRRLGTASFKLDELESLVNQSKNYGQALSLGLFRESIKEAFAEARASANSLSLPLRLRLFIKPEATELHHLYWETLRDPADNSYLLTTDENLPFSRYLLSKNWRSIQRRARKDLKGLVLIANPSDLEEYSLAPVDVNGELQRVEDALDQIDLTILPQPETERWSTADNLFDSLRMGEYDFLYLVCHGMLAKGEPHLWLENDEQKVQRLTGTEFITRLRELRQLPRVVVLASCQSASVETSGALTALGPRLVEEGIPAVVAMQGKVSMDTITEFMPNFFRSLQHHGEIDRAMAVARGSVRERHDFWMPVLFMRLKHGSVWYEPGFRSKQGERVKFGGWPGLVSSIQTGKCTPILGPGLYEWLLGTQSDIANRWADAYDYPMAPYERNSIIHVAQYLVATQRRSFVISELERHIKSEVLRYHQDALPHEIIQGNPTLNQLIAVVGAERRSKDTNEPYSVLARMPFPIYLTANPGNLLISALKNANNSKDGTKDPKVLLSPWNDATEAAFPKSLFGKKSNYSPNPDQPLVLHFFGRLDMEDSLVLTEDDYFDFLLGINEKLIPFALKSALANTSLLFLGFQMGDWNFRTLLRYILSLQGGALQRKHIHVAVQVNPEESGFLRPAGAYEYLDKYFTHEANIEVYWGSTEDFINELQEQYQKWAV